MAKKRSAMDCVMAAHEAAKNARPNKSWFSRLPPEAQKEMAEIKAEWVAGRLRVQNVVVFRGIVARCTEESWLAPKSESTIQRWLQSSEK